MRLTDAKERRMSKQVATWQSVGELEVMLAEIEESADALCYAIDTMKSSKIKEVVVQQGYGEFDRGLIGAVTFTNALSQAIHSYRTQRGDFKDASIEGRFVQMRPTRPRRNPRLAGKPAGRKTSK
jgi:hypothetical protein